MSQSAINLVHINDYEGKVTEYAAALPFYLSWKCLYDLARRRGLSLGNDLGRLSNFKAWYDRQSIAEGDGMLVMTEWMGEDRIRPEHLVFASKSWRRMLAAPRARAEDLPRWVKRTKSPVFSGTYKGVYRSSETPLEAHLFALEMFRDELAEYLQTRPDLRHTFGQVLARAECCLMSRTEFTIPLRYVSSGERLPANKYVGIGVNDIPGTQDFRRCQSDWLKLLRYAQKNEMSVSRQLRYASGFYAHWKAHHKDGALLQVFTEISKSLIIQPEHVVWAEPNVRRRVVPREVYRSQSVPWVRRCHGKWYPVYMGTVYRQGAGLSTPEEAHFYSLNLRLQEVLKLIKTYPNLAAVLAPEETYVRWCLETRTPYATPKYRTVEDMEKSRDYFKQQAA